MDTRSSSGGIGFVGLLTLAFIVLKLLGKLDWSWWWVLSPLWISMVLGVALLIVALLMLLIFYKRKSNRKSPIVNPP